MDKIGQNKMSYFSLIFFLKMRCFFNIFKIQYYFGDYFLFFLKIIYLGLLGQNLYERTSYFGYFTYNYELIIIMKINALCDVLY